MSNEFPLDKMAGTIRSIKKMALELKELSGGIEAVDRNVGRLLASVKMLEINISDVAEVVSKKTSSNDKAQSSNK